MWNRIAAVAVVLVPLGLSHGLAYWSGQSAERQRWQLEAAARKRDDNAAINDLQQRLRRQESAAASQLLAAENRYQKGLSDVEAEKNRIIAGYRAGAVRLSIPVKAAAFRPEGAAPGGSEGGADPAPRAELSDAAAGFLVGLAAEADAVAVELNRCADRVDVLQALLSGQAM